LKLLAVWVNLLKWYSGELRTMTMRSCDKNNQQSTLVVPLGDSDRVHISVTLSSFSGVFLRQPSRLQQTPDQKELPQCGCCRRRGSQRPWQLQQMPNQQELPRCGCCRRRSSQRPRQEDRAWEEITSNVPRERRREKREGTHCHRCQPSC
jgi:hypothetical protein